MAQDISDKYAPTQPPGGDSVDDLRAWVFDELQRLSLSLQETVALDLRPVSRSPTRPREGMIIFADGTSFNPGRGKGAYVYRDSDWFPLDEGVISKTADEPTNTDTTFSDDASLKFAVAASSMYWFHFVVFYDTPTAADFKWQLTGPAASTLILYNGFALPPGATSQTITRDNAFSSSHTITETSGTAGQLEIKGILQNGANAGTLAFQWAQNTSNGSNTTVRGGSHVRFGKVA